MNPTKILSCFIDESGDFGPVDQHSPYYYVAMVFHDQRIDISDDIRKLDEHVENLNYPKHAIHTGPLIRRESYYLKDERENRRALFNALYHFARKIDIQYLCPRIDKRQMKQDDIEVNMTAKLSREISNELQSHMDYFSKFSHIIVYYDNGQKSLTKIIASVFNTLFTDVEFRKVSPVDYKLFQVADLICTLELINDKADTNTMSASETEFFESPRAFRKNIYKNIVRKKL